MDELPAISDGEDKTNILKNRLRKNYRHLRKWAKRTHTNCFRLYDRDIKEFPLVIDFYAGRFCIQYFSEDPNESEPRADLKEEAEKSLTELFNISPDQIYWKVRTKRKKIQQYEKIDNRKEFFVVKEYGVKFWINLCDYLDTGLFLDHRETRQRVAKLSKGKRLLNLFAYTCAFSVQAAAKGALQTTSVDMSNTYTNWGRDNFELNNLSSSSNVIVREYCLKFIDEELARKSTFDLIVIDPPTLSRSKKMEDMFDIQKDHQGLLNKALKLLAMDGVIFFSTNSRRFELDPLPASVVEITDKTLPMDFRKKIHRCWMISKN
jgi:23S rRNA G2069 N7-methylase RlmK/C1962 C5-methylase RlmI